MTLLGRGIGRGVWAVICALALIGCGSEPRPEGAANSAVMTIAADLAAPWSIAFHAGVALVSERDSARILELTARGGTREVAVVGGVVAAGEGGLLGIAVREDLLYAYSTGDGGNRIQSFPLTGAPGSLGLGAASTLLDRIPSSNVHNGGRIAFGPDDMLYATAGDAGDGTNSQDLGSLSGKILRMRADGAVPADNPFPGSYVYTYGHRNPQGLAWDEDGAMYATEFGQDTWDELNVIVAGGNYGWPEVEGIAGQDGYRDPVQQWPPAQASPSGMAIAGGSIWIANLRGARLREVPLADTSSGAEHLVGQYGRLRDAVRGPDGGLWVLTNNTDGRGDPAPADDQILEVAVP